MGTKIEWATETVNPIAGCQKCSPECQHCYAEGMSARLARMPQTRAKYASVVTNGRFNGQVAWNPSALDKLAQWRAPRTVFMESMGDLFAEMVEGSWIQQVFDACYAQGQHRYMFLTKRPERMLSEARWWVKLLALPHLPDNWHFGVTAGTQQSADERIPVLLKLRDIAPQSVLYVSGEPLLEDVRYCGLGEVRRPLYVCGVPDPVSYERRRGIDALFIGCESGPKRRHTDLAWIRHSIAQATAAGIPIMVKQAEIDGRLVKLPEIDGRVWDALPPALAGKAGA